MPVRHSSPPSDAETPETETLKRPNRRKTKEPRSEDLQNLSEAGSGSPTLQNVSPTPDKQDNSPAAHLASASPPPESQDVVAPVTTQSPSGTAKRSHTSDPPPGGVITIDGVDFHHGSEAEFARLLTYYGLEWQYEPNQFPLQWHQGRPTEMFSPDFYLPEYDLYIELTTMRQALVRRKNRKLRLLRALYPEINIKLLYRRDYNRLLERFGISPEELEAELPLQGEEAES